MNIRGIGCGILVWLGGLVQASGEDHGYVQVWGSNQWQSVPAVVRTNATTIVAGGYHCLALVEGRVYAWGDGRNGQTNVDANAVSGVKAIAAGTHSSAAIKNGEIVLWGDSENTSNHWAFVTVPTNGPYKAVALGANHGLAIREDDGTVEAWGNDSVGQVAGPGRDWGVGITAVAAGKEFSLGLNENGEVFVSGEPENVEGVSLRIGEIPGEVQSGVTAIAAGPFHAMALKDGRVWVWGAWKEPDSTPDIPDVPKGAARAAFGNVTNVPEQAQSDVVAIAAGYNECAAIKKDGSVVMWGNELGSDLAKQIPRCAEKDVKEISLGFHHAMARTAYQPPILGATALPEAHLETEYTGQLTAMGNPPPTFYVKGALPLPGGLALDSETGAITGIPEAVGTNRVMLAATNAYGEDAATFTIVVRPRKTAPPVWNTTSLPVAVVGTWYETRLDATENPVYSIDSSLGALPRWAKLTSDGLLRGWPDGVGSAYPTFIASNSVGATNRLLPLNTVNPTNVPAITGEGSLPDAVQNERYGSAIQPPGAAQTWGYPLEIAGAPIVTVSSGQLPAGLVLNGTNGYWWIEGTPTAAGEETEFTLSATNAAGTSSGTWRISVNGPPQWVNPGVLPTGRVGVEYRETLQARGATSYEKVSGTWPAGLSWSQEDGDQGKIAVVSGTPTRKTEQPAVVRLRAVNSLGRAEADFTISVTDAAVPDFHWTGIRRAGGTVILTWTNKADADTTAWVGSTTNLMTGWATNAPPAEAGWIRTNSPAVLDVTGSPRYYLLQSQD